jgi:hypothetical protein
VAIPNIRNMTNDEKLQTLEAVWAELESSTLTSPMWHKDIIEERLKHYNKSDSISLEDVANEGYKKL